MNLLNDNNSLDSEMTQDSQIVDDELEKIANLNLNLKIAYFLPEEKNNSFDKDTGLCAERITENYEIALFLENGGYTDIDGKKYNIHKGDLRFLRPNQKLVSKKFGDFFSIHLTISSEDNSDPADSIIIRDMPSFMPSYNLKSYVNICKELILAHSSNTIEDMLLAKYKINKLFYKMYLTSQNHKKSADMSDKSRTIIITAIEFMENNISNSIGLDEISASVDLHPVYFNRVFSKSMGIPPIGYLKKLRLNKAKALLLTTNMKVVNIAKKCGFTTSSYFIVQFRKEFGCTPSEYRAISNEDFYSISI